MTGVGGETSAPRTDELRGASAVTETARAKVNLTLEILGRRDDGYHELRSLVAFTAFGDELRFAPGCPFALQIDGPFASALDGGNLIHAAAALYALTSVDHGGEASGGGGNGTLGGTGGGGSAAGTPIALRQSGDEAANEAGGAFRCLSGEFGSSGHPSHKSAPASGHPKKAIALDLDSIGTAEAPSPTSNARQPEDAGPDNRANHHPSGVFHLIKRIPVAAGLGGGSADAAAALRLLARQHPGRRDLPALLPLAAKLGADVPACLFSQPAIMTGIGERLRMVPAFPALPIVLVNPRLPLSTAAVFRELGAAPLTQAPPSDDLMAFPGIDAVIGYAAARRNDLEAPARRLLPIIGAILDRLAQCRGALLARLSGSGPTCFALFSTQSEAASAAADLRAGQPGWWIEATILA